MTHYDPFFYKGKLLSEEFHRNAFFDMAIEQLASKILNIIVEAYDSDDPKNVFAQYQKDIRTDFYYCIKNDSIEVIKNVNSQNNHNRIILRFRLSDSGTMSVDLDENKNIVLICYLNNIILHYENLKFNEISKSGFYEGIFQYVDKKMLELLKNAIAHELNGHASRLLRSGGLAVENEKIDHYKEIVDNLENETLDDKNVILSFFYYFQNNEIDARINEIDYALKNISDDFVKSLNGKSIQDKIKACMQELSLFTKLSEIDANYAYLKKHHLLDLIAKIDYKEHIGYFSKGIEKTMKIYELRVMRQIYKVLYDDLHIAENSLEESIIVNEIRKASKIYGYFDMPIENIFLDIF